MKQWVMEFNFFGVRCVFFPSCVFISNREPCYSDIYAVVSEDLYEVHWGVPLACVVSKKTMVWRVNPVSAPLWCKIILFDSMFLHFYIMRRFLVLSPEEITYIHSSTPTELTSEILVAISVPKSFTSGELWTQQILVLINFISQLNWKRCIWKWLLAL